MSNKNLVTFLDAAQRTIIGELINETPEFIHIQNPVVVNIVPQFGEKGQPSGGMALQLLPVYFKEFQGVKKNPVVFKYVQSQITRIDFEGGFDFRLYGQYDHIFNPQEIIQPTAVSNIEPPATPATSAAPVLKLFDEVE
ncbi:MAG: hypothetical protein WC905_00795 [Patescibacteria group bacterium]|jgi:hypothetical protein